MLRIKKSIISQIPLIILGILSLIFSHNSYAWEKWEQRLIDKGCWQFEEKKVNQEFMRCFQLNLTNVEHGQVSKISRGSTYLLGCAADKDFHWCDIYLISHTGFVALFISLENNQLEISKKNKFALNILSINSYALGDLCHCKVKEWAIETDRSIFYSNSSWTGKEATPVIESINKSKTLAIYASIPNGFKDKYRLEFKNSDLIDFRSQLNDAINYTSMSDKN